MNDSNGYALAKLLYREDLKWRNNNWFVHLGGGVDCKIFQKNLKRWLSDPHKYQKSSLFSKVYGFGKSKTYLAIQNQLHKHQLLERLQLQGSSSLPRGRHAYLKEVLRLPPALESRQRDASCVMVHETVAVVQVRQGHVYQSDGDLEDGQRGGEVSGFHAYLFGMMKK